MVIEIGSNLKDLLGWVAYITGILLILHWATRG